MRRRWRGGIVVTLCAACAASVAIALAAVFVFLCIFALPVFMDGQGFAVITGFWQPAAGVYGVLPMLQASMCVAGTALILGFPLAMGICCGMNGLAPEGVAQVFRGLVRCLTAVPTVVYGFAALFLLVPLVREAAGRGTGLCWLTASLVLALLVVPTMVLVMEAGMGPVAERVRLTGAAMGFTRGQVLVHMVLPLCKRHMAGAAALGFGRAMGDTLLPLMLAGNAVQTPGSPLESVRTLTAHIALVLATDSRSGTYGSLFVAGCLLLLLNLAVQVVLRVLARYGARYGARYRVRDGVRGTSQHGGRA